VTDPEHQSPYGARGPEDSRDTAGTPSPEDGRGRWSGEYTPGSDYGTTAPADQTRAYGLAPGQGEPMPGYPGQYAQPAPYGQAGYTTHPGGYAPAPYPGYPPLPVSRKKKVVAALLAFFIGGTGSHNFYIGNTGRAIAQLVFLVVTWILVIAGYALVIAGTGTETVSGYSGRTYYVDEDPDMIIAGGLTALLGYLSMAGLWIWTMVEFIMILTSTGRYGRDRDGFRLA
jgi:TM2 domain-containing membrane protein YozV